MKTSFYFNHDLGARNDPKLQEITMEFGMEGVGIYWCLVELLYEQDGYLLLDKCPSYAFALRCDEKKIRRIVEIAFETDETRFWSDGVLKRIEITQEKRDKARKSAERRWKDSPQEQEVKPAERITTAMRSKLDTAANALQTHSEGNAIHNIHTEHTKQTDSNLSNDKLEPKYGHPLVNFSLELFESTYGFQPIDKRFARKRAWNLVQTITTLIKKRNLDLKKKSLEERAKGILEAYFGWVAQEKSLEGAKNMEVIVNNFDYFRSKHLEKPQERNHAIQST